VSLTPGSYQITASYSGSPSDGYSNSAASTMAVTADTTTTTLNLPSTKFTEGQSVTVTATVKAAAGSTPTGSVNFLLGTEQIGTGELSNGVATFSASVTLSPGTYTGTATYTGSTNDSASTSSAITFTVVAATASTTTTLTSSATQVTEGNSLQLTATVTPQTQGGGAATGAVTFFLGQTALGTGQLAGGQAVLSLATTQLSPGSYQLTAVYAGDSNDNGSTSNPVSLIVSAPAAAVTATQLTASSTQLTAGQSTVLVGRVTASGTSTTPTGIVNFYLGQTQIGSATLAGGAASFTYAPSLTPGTYQVTAIYAGNTQDAASTSAPLTITIAPSVVATSTSLVSSATQINQGQAFSLTAVVTPASGSTAPQGTVTFYLGQTQMGTATLVNGTAVFTEPNALAPGSYQLTAVYAGNAQDSSSTSNPLLIVVSPVVVPTTTALTASATQITPGQPVSLTAVVTPGSGSVAPQGSVSFFLGQTQIGTSLLNNGVATLVESSSLTPGSYQVTAVYAGNTQDSASSSNPISLIVAMPVQQPLPTSVAVSVNPQQPITGQSMSLQVQVTATGNTSPIMGTVTLYMGQTSVGTANVVGGIASLTMIAPQPGSYTATASYAGQGDLAGSQSSPISFTVQAPSTVTTPPPPPPGSFTLGLSSATLSLGKAETASLQVNLGAVNGYTGTVQLSCAGLPAGVSCSFSPADVSIAGSPATSTLVFSSQTNNAYSSPMITNVAQGLLLPWDIIGLLGFISGRKRLRGRRSAFVTLCLALLCSTIWMTGCGLSVNSMNQPYQVTVTAVGQNQVTQSTTLTLYVTQPAATF